MLPATRADRPLSGAWLDLFWRRLGAEAGVGDVRLHDLSHTHASIALRQGRTVLAISKLLGHTPQGVPLSRLKHTRVRYRSTRRS